MSDMIKLWETYSRSEDFKTIGSRISEGCGYLDMVDRYIESSGTLSHKQLTTPFSC